MSQDPLNTPKKAKARTFDTPRKSRKDISFRKTAEQITFRLITSEILADLEIKSVRDLEHKLYELINDLETEKLIANEYITLTQTSNHAEAKQKIRSLMDNASDNSTPLL